MLFRGKAFRFGCDHTGVLLQQEVAGSYKTHLVGWLKGAGGKDVEILLTLACDCCDESTRNALLDVHLASAPVRATALVGEASAPHLAQPMQIRAALQLFERAGGVLRYEALIVARNDVMLNVPLPDWLCGRHLLAERTPERLCLASKCGTHWDDDRCVSDIQYIVPRRFYSAFNASVGSHYIEQRTNRAPRCVPCFAELGGRLAKVCEVYGLRGHGHHCYDQLAARIGHEHLGFIWPPPRSSELFLKAPTMADGRLAYLRPPLNRMPSTRYIF